MPTPTNLYEYYQSQGQALPSVQDRQGSATSAGISNYTGTAAQNTQLLAYLQQHPTAQNVGNQSTTTLSSSNPASQVPAIQNTTQNYANTFGTTGNPQTGVTTNADGSQYQPYQPAQPATTQTGGYFGEVYYAPGSPTPTDSNGNPVNLTATSTGQDQILGNLNQQLSQTDSQTASMIQAIQAQYRQLIQQQQQTNKGQEAKVNNALLMGGVTGKGSSSQYAPISSEGIIGAQVSYGLQQIADLNNKEQMAIAQAQAAGNAQRFQVQDKINNQIAQIREEKQKAAIKLNDTLLEQSKKVQDQNILLQKEQAIENIYSSGTTDISEAMKKLRSSGVNASVKEVSDTFNLLSGVGGTGIVGEYNFYKADAMKRGQVPVDFNTYQNMDANRKKSIAAAGVASAGSYGLNPKQTQNFLSITTKFQADPFINNAIKGQTAIQIADQVLSNPKSATNQLKALYSLVKNLDPDSAVKEGETALASKTQSYLDNFQTSLTRIGKGQVISEKAAKALAIATKELAQSWSDTAKRRESQYKAQSKVAGIGDVFNEYLQESNLGYNTGSDIIENEEQAKSKVVNYGTSNPKYRPIILKKVNEINPYTQKKYTYSELLQIYPEIK